MTKTATRIPDYDPIEAMRDLMDMFHNARHEFADFGFGPEEPRDESGKWTAENIKGHLMARPGDKLADIAKGLGVKKQRGVAWENHPLGKAVAGMVASGHVEPKGEGYRMAARQPTVARLATAQPAASLPVDFPAKVLSSAKAAAAKGGHGVGSLGDKVTIAHAHRAYQQQHGQIPLDQFKQGLMKNRNNGISLMREDRPQRFDEPMQEDLRQSTIANPLNSNGMYDWHWLSTEPSQSSPVTAPALSAPVDTSRQLGLFARDDRGNPQEIGEQAGQANLFNMGKYALAEKPREEKVKPQFDPKHTGLLFCAEFASEYRDFMAMVNQARNDFASLFDKGPSTGGQGTLQWRTIGAEEGEDGKKHGGTHVLMNVESGEIAKGPKALAGKKVGELKSSGQQQSAPAPSKPSTGPKFSNPKKHPLYDQKTGRPMVHPDKPIEPAKGESETRPPERIAKPGAVDLTPQQSSPAAKPEPDIVRAAKFYGQMPPGYDKDRRIDPKSLPEHKPLTETTKSDEPKSDEELAKTEELVPNLERPWEMSGEDYLRAKQKQAKVFGEPELGAGIYNQQHEQEVAQAANRGEEIPEHVLNEYPHLAGEAMTEHHRRQQQEEMAHKIAEANSDMTDIPPQDTDTATAPPQQPIGIDGSQPTNQPPGLPSPAVQGDPANAPATRQSQEESSATVSSPQVQGIPTPATANETGQPAQQVAAAVPPAAAQQNPSVAGGEVDRQTPAVAGSTQGRTPTPTETAAPTTPVSEPENAATERTTPASPGIAKENQGDGRADSQPASGSEVAGEPAPGTQGQAEQTPEHAKLPESVKQRIQGHLDDIRDMKTALAHSREDRRVTQGTGIGTISGEDTPKEKALAAEIQQAEGKLDDFRQRAKSAGVDGDKVIDELSFKPSAERHDAIHKELSDIDQKMRSGKVQYPEIRELHNRRVDLEDELRHHKPAAWEREGQAVAKRAAQAASPAKPAAPTYSGTPAPTDEQMESAEMGNPTARSRSGEPILSDDQEKQWRDLRGQHHEHAYVHVPSAKRAMERAKAKADRIVKEKASQMDAANTLREHADRSGDSAHAQELRNQAQKHEQAANRMTDDVVKAQDEYAVAHQAHTDAITKRDAIAQQKEQLRPGSKWNDITRDPTSFAPMTPQQQTEHAKQLQKSHAVNQKAQAESAKREAQEKKKAEREQKQKEAEAAKASRPAKGEKPFSKADIQRKLIEAHKAQGGDTGEEDDKALADYHSPFTFLRTDKTKSGYPGEVERFLQQGKDRAKFNKLFSLTDDPAKAQGSDAMGNMGEDKYFDLAERRAGGENRQAIDWAHKSNDPEHRFLAALHDNTSVDTRALRSQLNSTRKQADKLEAKGDKISAEKKRALAQKIEDGLAKDAQSKRAPKDILKPDEVKEGDHFSIYGVPVDVVEGEDGGLDLKDHGDIPQTPVDALSAIPVDRGSKKHIAESELSDLDDPFADVMDEPSEEELRGERHHPDDVREAMRAEGVDPDHANETIKKLEAQHAATQGKKPEDASKESARTQEARPPTQAGGSDRPATGGAAQEEGVSPDTSHLVALRNGLSHEQSRLNNAKTDSERKHRQVWVNQYKKQIADEMKHLGMSGDEDSPDISDEDLLKSLGESSQEEGVLRPNPLKPSEESPHADELESGISAARKAGFTDQHIAQIHQQMQDKDGVLVVDPKKQSMRFYPSSSIFEPNKTPEQRRDEMGKVAGQKFLVKNASKKRASDAEKYQDRVHREGDWDSGNLAGWQRDILEQGVKSGKLTKRQGREDERTAMGIPTVYEPAGGKIANPPSMTPEQKAFYQNSQGWDNPAADTDHPLDRPLNRRPRANFSTDLDDVERKMDRMLAIAALV